MPVSGYSNPNVSELANSKNPNSWPENWDDWFGEYGTGKTIANNEIYYVMNDFNNAEFNYYPSISKQAIRGLGVSAEVRIYQFGGGLKDALIIKYFVKNEGKKPLDKVYFGFQADPHIGGVGDYNDDVVRIANINFDNIKVKSNFVSNTIYLYDYDQLGRGGKKPGYLSFKFLETPNNLGLTSFHAPQWGLINPKDDYKMWKLFSEGIDTLNYLYDTPGDNVIHFGTGPFSLLPNETKIIKLVIFLSHNYDDLIEDATYISLHHNWPLIGNQINMRGGDSNYKIQLSEMPNIINDSYNISWTYSGVTTNSKVFLEYSFNKGEDWFPLAVSLNPDDNFTWNTNEIDDGVNYILRLVAYNDNNPKEYFYDISPAKFTVDNPQFNAKPELELITAFKDTVINSSPLKIEWISEDADNNELNIKIEYAFNFNGPYSEINTYTYKNGLNNFIWDIKEFPNTQNCYVRITASDGEKDTTLITNSFSINVYKNILSNSHIKNYRGNATPIIQIQTIDESQLKNDEYSILFKVNNDVKTFDIKNITNNEILLSNYTLNENISTPLLDGMKIIIKDSGNEIDDDKTKYKSNSSNYVNYNITFPPVLGGNKIKIDNDYLIIFNDFDTLSNGDWVYPDTMQTLLGEVFAPFSIWNIEGQAPNFNLKEPATFVLYEPIVEKQNNSKWDLGESIILQPQGTTEPITSYQISFDINDNMPRKGDSLFIITFNQIEDNDEFRFSPDSNFVVNVKEENTFSKFELLNNYPNPFNPSTIIEYVIPAQSFVKLKIYDALGKEVKTLVNEIKSARNYKVEFDAASLASGIYFYRLQNTDLTDSSGKTFVQTKKMLLIK